MLFRFQGEGPPPPGPPIGCAPECYQLGSITLIHIYFLLHQSIVNIILIASILQIIVIFFTGWFINNRTILNCSQFLANDIFFNPFSPKQSIHTGKLPQQHEIANASFVILFRCHFVSPYHVDGSANNVLCRGGHFCEIAGVLAHIISSQVQLEQENSLNSLKRYLKTS